MVLQLDLALIAIMIVLQITNCFDRIDKAGRHAVDGTNGDDEVTRCHPGEFTSDIPPLSM